MHDLISSLTSLLVKGSIDMAQCSRVRNNVLYPYYETFLDIVCTSFWLLYISVSIVSKIQLSERTYVSIVVRYLQGDIYAFRWADEQPFVAHP